jgi:glycosyltransferase involved in cell wall biosynthesis
MTDFKHRILFVVQHRFDRSPGQRYRFEQYMPYLEAEGFECVYSPILVDAQEDKDFYSPGNYLNKFSLFLKGAWRRWKDGRRAKNFDIVFVYREAFMTGTIFFEKMLKQSGAKIIYDFDDAIWNHDISAANRALGWLKNPAKVADITALADLVFVGNQYLADYASQYNKRVEIIPSTINLDYYRIAPKQFTHQVVIGWSGSLTTIEHFKVIIPVLEKVKAKYGHRVAFKVFGVPDYVHESLGITGIQWTPQNEVSEISSFDIGIMPLPDNKWTKGKCGMKGLQYMALEVATTMTAVGVNKDIIQEGENGFLATTEDEWYEKICQLVESKELREKFGKAGRITIEQHYSSQALRKKYVNLFHDLINKS